MSNDFLLTKSMDKIAAALERNLKTDRSLVVEESVILMARKICLELGINPRIGSVRNEMGRRMHKKIIWFADRVQKEIFLEAYSMSEEDPKDLVEENVFTVRERFTVVEPDGS